MRAHVYGKSLNYTVEVRIRAVASSDQDGKFVKNYNIMCIGVTYEALSKEALNVLNNRVYMFCCIDARVCAQLSVNLINNHYNVHVLANSRT